MKQTPWPKNIYVNNEAELAAAIGLRPEVLAFAELMEEKLKANDSTYQEGAYSYRTCSIAALLQMLRDHTSKLELRLDASEGGKTARDAADIANFAMMIADVVGGLKE